MSRVWISVGSNIDRERSVRAALWELRRLFGDLVISPVYETAAVGFDGDAFLNLVVGIETARAPGELHALLRDIEASHGRVRSAARFDARTLDLDVLTYGDAVTDEGGKQLPRDEILKYAFVLGPLAESSLRQSLLSSQGDASIFFTRPISGICMLIALALVLYPAFLNWKRKREAATA